MYHIYLSVILQSVAYISDMSGNNTKLSRVNRGREQLRTSLNSLVDEQLPGRRLGRDLSSHPLSARPPPPSRLRLVFTCSHAYNHK